MGRRRGDFWVGATLCGLSVALYFAVPYYANTTEGTVLTPASFPLGLSALIAGLSAIVAIAGFRQAPSALHGDEPTGSRSLIVVLATVAVTAVYIAAMPWLGYLLSTALALCLLSLLYGNRRILGIAAMMVLVPPALFFFFERVMLVLLPRGGLF
ncbi:MAG: tripartite tricarboxylate transporter TctB family protein [Candidatus Methylomirabilia bacterium]